MKQKTVLMSIGIGILVIGVIVCIVVYKIDSTKQIPVRVFTAAELETAQKGVSAPSEQSLLSSQVEKTMQNKLSAPAR